MKSQYQRLERIERCLYIIAHRPNDLRYELESITQQMLDELEEEKRFQDAVTESMGLNKKEPGER